MTASSEHPLHVLHVGSAGPRVAFLHGLFGQGRNWNQIAKAVAGQDGSGARCALVDLPDHGRSRHTSEFSFTSYAAHVAATLRQLAPGEPWTVVGHSLGGKTAMVLALTEPELVERLCVVDIAPKHYGDLHRFGGYIDAMTAMDLEAIETRQDADAMLAQTVPQPWIRAFLLQNLRRHHDTWRWQVNLPLVRADRDRGSESVIADFPIAPGEHEPYEGPVVWLVGGDSEYVHDEDVEPMRELFPRARLVTVNGAGHWVHTDAPEVVIEVIRRMLDGPSGSGDDPPR